MTGSATKQSILPSRDGWLRLARHDGLVVTVPLRRQGTGREVAYAALFTISNEFSYVNAQRRRAVTCGASLHGRNGSGIALAAAMHMSLGSVIFWKSQL